MMKRGGIRKNNRGDSLILVIGCIALLSVLGIVILAKSVDNQTMKVAERSAQESFFAADSTSAEVATVLEAVAMEAVEDAFSDMLVEYSNSGDDATRKQRFETYFLTRLDQKLRKQGDNKLEKLLSEALGGGTITNVTIKYDNPEPPVSDPDDTEGNKSDIIKIKNVELTYSANGSKTTIKTDISIQTQIPDVTGGFRSSVDCFFSDFTLISDGTVSMVGMDGAIVAGNMYSGDDLLVSGSAYGGSAYTLDIANASKVLVKDTVQVDAGGLLQVKNGTVPEEEGPSIWANDISVVGGGFNTSRLLTEGMNVYISDDLTIDGDNSEVKMTGSLSEYVGFSGGVSTSGLPNYKKSSAITINSAKNLNLDLSGLQRLVLTGTSYIHEPEWKDADGTSIDEGIMQGESVAYKDMQAMYLVPNECMAAGHNPVMTDTEPMGTVFGETFMLGSTEIKWSEYLASSPVVTHTLLLDNGATKVTYVYLNFKSETAAARYAEAYLNSPLGVAIRERATHLGTSSSIKFPADTKTRGAALTYNGTGAGFVPAVDAANLSLLSTEGLSARIAYYGLFTSLREGAGVTLKPDYKMVANGIISLSEIPDDVNNTEIERWPIAHPTTGDECFFYLYKGDLTIGGSSPYRNVDGILLVVDGNVTYEATNATVNGLLLTTGTVTIKNKVTFTPDEELVEALLAEEEVAKYFKGFGDSDQSFLSSEAVDITFENWKRN